VQAADLGGLERVGAARGVDAGVPQRLVHIDVAEAGDRGLVQEKGLDHPVLSLELPPQDIFR
jgi:hypothetical protein